MNIWLLQLTHKYSKDVLMNEMCLYVQPGDENHSYPQEIHKVQGSSYHTFLAFTETKITFTKRYFIDTSLHVQMITYATVPISNYQFWKEIRSSTYDVAGKPASVVGPRYGMIRYVLNSDPTQCGKMRISPSY